MDPKNGLNFIFNKNKISKCHWIKAVCSNYFDLMNDRELSELKDEENDYKSTFLKIKKDKKNKPEKAPWTIFDEKFTAFAEGIQVDKMMGLVKKTRHFTYLRKLNEMAEM